MLLWIVLFFVIIFVLLFAVGFIPEKCVYDYDAPLNMIMYQEPSARYSEQLVNLWITKTWRSDGRKIPCRYEQFRTDLSTPANRRIIVYSHGNAEDLLYCAPFVRELSEKLKIDVLAWDYSGYGLNTFDKFERSPEGVNLSLQTIINYLVDQSGYTISNIIFWGYSLGSGVSTHLAASLSKTGTPPAALILFGAYSSILDVVKYSTSPEIANLFQERWSNKDVIGSVSCPVLIMHGQSDGLIPSSHADVLASKQPFATKIILPNTGHTQFSWSEAIKEVRTWMESKVNQSKT